jgi:nucleoside-diphosphate-sugar epimerase
VIARLIPGAPVVVTGCAGFLGSQLCERLVDIGHDVTGVDCFTPYYSRAIKERNLERLRDEPAFFFNEIDLARDDIDGLLEGAQGVFHLAAQAGVRDSFGARFADYVENNVLATQRLLEQAVVSPVRAFVYASSSSVYGNSTTWPTTERSPRRPVSPYGMTKLATEELASVYMRCFGVPVVGLRYFTAYGPRQRPDMAFSRFMSRALAGESLPVNGHGDQIRDFTFVADVIDGTIAAARRGRVGAVYNIGGGCPVRLVEAIALIAGLVGRPVSIQHRPAPLGDPARTGCDGARATRDLRFTPRTKLEDGLAAQLEWTLAQTAAPLEAVAA